MKLYTKTGDDGTTGLYGGDRVSKTSLRIQAIGEIDELNALIGVARIHSDGDALDDLLARVQSWLFDLGAELACPPNGKFQVELIGEGHLRLLEASIDEQDRALPELKAFILPGGSELSAQLHLARCVCRRSERIVLQLAETEQLREVVRIFLNRLSDWLFVSARTANASRHVKDIEWKSSEIL